MLRFPPKSASVKLKFGEKTCSQVAHIALGFTCYTHRHTHTHTLIHPTATTHKHISTAM